MLIAVPTLGERNDYLERSILSILSQDGRADVVVVCPERAEGARAIAARHGLPVLNDPGTLSGAINLGVSHGVDSHRYVSWLGDDDSLLPGSLDRMITAMDARPDVAAAFGYCRYVDPDDRTIGVSRAGRWAPRILGWGPNLLPQPGMLVRSEAWQRAGGLDESLHYAMDLDLLLKLKKLGGLHAVPVEVSTFRWHPGSLTVSTRDKSFHESVMVRRRYLPRSLLRVSPVWEKPVGWATTLAANRVNHTARKLADEDPGSAVH